MKNKGQISMGPILLAFIGIILGVTLFITIQQLVVPLTEQDTATNITIAYPSAANGTTDMIGQELFGTPIVTLWNITGTVYPGGSGIDGNFTITEEVSNGVKTIQFKRLDSGQVMDTAKVNITYDFGPDGYIDNGGARSVALMIGVFAALAIAVVALSPTLRSGVLEMLEG